MGDDDDSSEMICKFRVLQKRKNVKLATFLQLASPKFKEGRVKVPVVSVSHKILNVSQYKVCGF